jgi:hypothetical protein
MILGSPVPLEYGESTMKKYLIPALFSLFAMLGRSNVAVAAEHKSILDDAATVVVGTGAIGAAITVNVPVSIGNTVAKSVGDINDKIRKDLDLDDSPVSVAAASLPALPIGTTYGAVKGTGTGTKEALVTYRDLIDYTFWDHVGFNVR